MGAAAIVGIMVDDVDDEDVQAQERRDAIRMLNGIKRHLRDVSNPFLLEPEYFRKHYR